MRKWIALLTIMVAVSSCGTKLAETENASSVPGTEIPIDRNGLVFDPSAEKIPFPNDIMWSQYGGNVTLPVDEASDNATKLLYRAINALHIKGFSPNMFIGVPLMNDKSLTDVSGHFKLIDLTDFQVCAASNGTSAACLGMDETVKLTFRQDGDFLKFYPVRPLDAGHQYLFVLENGIKDNSGNEILESVMYKELETNDTLLDPQLEALREEYKPLYDSVLPQFGLYRDNVLEIFTFTTANKTLSINDFGVINEALTNSTVADNLESLIGGLNYTDVPLEYRGIETFILSGPVAPLLGFVNGTNNTVMSVNIAEQTLMAVPYSIFNGANFSTYNDTVYVFLHGLGANRTVAQLLTGDIPYAVVSIDLPYHGDRVLPDDNPYTTCYENVSGSCFLTENPGSDRINFYQSIFDARVVLRALASGRFDIDGDGTPDVPKNIDLVGMSLGSIVGGSLLGIDSATNNTISKAVLNVGAANLVSVLDTATNSMITNLLGTLGVEKNSIDYFVTLGIFQTLLDPADPSYLAGNVANKTIIQSAYGDSILPYVSNLSFAKSIGFSNYTEVDFSNVTVAPGWYMFGNSSAYVNHGFLLSTNTTYYPEVSDYLADESVLQDAQKAAREQIKDFFQ
ncbi:hypothetical protein [Desulfurobacterium sp. TC5-1]|uniref:hypothetical protein n=1 Tax=Desulfurobacterium sp. TC5-1 TaxID=1158318 RepID=UPI0003B4DA48|nr:hypothetical protein [Desulfurobacterium sp. TC5-1]